ncbi:MAG: SagB/ThcOx family dehydrogenase, partial [Cyanobacteria bacterium CAN_BIN43]|nr:SagB/ThcOx family dehydrogenase [Cyanobacteria bacterium CAN_BIN43]
MPDHSLSLAQHYHERTKYHPDALPNRQIDWANQPSSFKQYKIGTPFDLKPYLSEKLDLTTEESNWRRLSRFLFCSYGLTVKMMAQNGEPIYLRAAPSAGGLYPAEIYLISRGTPMMPAGLYNYQPQSHSLLHFWDSEVWSALQSACFWHPTLESTQFALVTTAVFYRSAWRYEDRAYRRILLDTGHLLGNFELAGALNDYRPYLIGGFADESMNQLLYLDTEQEGTTTVMAIADLLDVQQNLSLAPTALPSASVTDYPKIMDGDLLRFCHTATQIPQGEKSVAVKDLAIAPPVDAEENPSADKYNFPFCLKVSTQTMPIDWGENLEGLGNALLKRRSTRAYRG